VSEMDTGFQHFAHRDRHRSSKRLVLEFGSNRNAGFPRKASLQHLERAGSRFVLPHRQDTVTCLEKNLSIVASGCLRPT